MMEQDEYQIRVQGWIGTRWSIWLDGLTLTHEGTEGDSASTLLTGPVVDQAGLRSLLNKIWDLNLTVLAVSRTETSAKRKGVRAHE